MTDKYKNKFTVIILAIVALAVVIGCAENNPKKVRGTDNASRIIGTWKRTDRDVGSTCTFTADGDYIVNMKSGPVKGKYELNGDLLRTYFPEAKSGGASNTKIFKLEDDLLILETVDDFVKKYSKLERVAD